MKVIGEVKEFGYPDSLPMCEVISNETHARKSDIVAYLRSGEVVSACPAIWRDIFTGEKIPGEELVLSDGIYAWRSDVAYYVEKYNMRLPEEFINYVLAKKQTAL